MTVMQLQLRQYSQSRGSYSSSGSSVAVTSSVIIRPNCTRLRPVQWDHKKLSERIGTRLYAASPGELPQQPDSLPPASRNAGNDSTTAESSAAATPADTTAKATADDVAAPARAGAAGADAVTKARQEFSDSWELLRDAAKMAFVPGYKQQAAAAAAAARHRQPRRYSDLLQELATDSLQQQQQQQKQDVLSFPDRLGRLFSGQFIAEREASRRTAQQQQQQQMDPQLAAVQFEMQQRLQKQQPSAATAAATAAAAAPPPAAAAAAAVSVDADGIIDVAPDTSALPAAAASAPTADPTSSSASVSDTNSASTAAAAAGLAGQDFYPATTQVLVVCTWAVFLLQWAQALPDLWRVLTGGGLLDAVAAMLLAFPDTPVTQSLYLDLMALQRGQGWSGLLSSGLCNSGFVATWICCAALDKSGRFLEAGTGQLQLLTVFFICTLAASLGHIFAGRCAIGVAGPGAVLGVYTTWSIVATQYMRDVVPLRTVYTQGLMLLALLLVVGLLQPAVSPASLLGGMIGGALAVQIAAPCSKALRWCLALPAMAGLLLLKLLVDLVQVVWFGSVFVAAAAWQFVQDVVGTVRRL